MKIRTDILRVYKSLHTWVGISAGLFLFIAFFAGALTMFKQPIDRWISPPQQVLSTIEGVQYDQLIKQVLKLHPAARSEFTIHLQQHENITAPITWQEEESGRLLNLSTQRWHATLDQNATLQAEQILPSALAELIDLLHRTAGVPGVFGHDYFGVYLLGVVSILYFLALVSGLIILLPTLVKDFLAVRDGKNKKRFWLDAHNVIGVTSLPFHIMISLTVIVFAFHDVFYDSLNNVVYNEPVEFTLPSKQVVTPPLEKLLRVEQILKKIKQEAPDFKVTELLFLGLDTPQPRLRASIYNPNYVVNGPITGYIGIDPFTGNTTDTSMLPTKANSWSQIVSTLFALHFGSYGGDLVRWVYFFLGISGSFLFYSGNLLWIESRRKKQKANLSNAAAQTTSTKLMASLTVGVCLGSIAAIAMTLVVGKWAYPWVNNINYFYLLTYYVTFIGAIAWAFYMGAAKSAVHLLRLCSLSALLIPLTSILAYFVPGLNIWTNLSVATLSVDGTALGFAVIFWYLAKRTAYRVQNGTKDSVWSNQPLI